MINNLFTNPKYAGIRHAAITGFALLAVNVLQAAAVVDWGTYTPWVAMIVAGVVGQLKGAYTA